jgi:hypothetical protein
MRKVEFIALTLALGTIIGLVAPAVQAARQEDGNKKLMANLKELAVAVHMSHDQNKTMPPYCGNYGGKIGDYTFHQHLLPFVEQVNLWNDPKDGKGVVPVFVSTLDPTHARDGAGTANFAVNIRLLQQRRPG